MLRISLVLAALCAPFIATSQHEADHWYFGAAGGLDFSGGAPVSSSPSSISTNEGCAAMSDAAGTLQFYTDGITVWDRTHAVMSNGNGLIGNFSSTQSGVAIPDPGNINEYYIFSCAQLGQAGGLAYSKVDMTMNGGLGAVTTKNAPLLTPVSEKVTAVNHANGRDIWVIAHEWNSGDFYAWLVTPSGIQAPVVTTVGFNHSGSVSTSAGYMRASSQGDRVGLCLYSPTNAIELLDFNNATGVLSNPIFISGVSTGTYGIEFSGSGQYLYVSEAGGRIMQFDLSSGVQATIAASQTILATGTSPGALQMGPDGIIYCASYGSNSLDGILFPDLAAPNCQFVADQVMLQGTSRYGLPNFITSFFNPAVFEVKPVCTGDTVILENFIPNLIQGQSYYWELGDGRIDTALYPDIVYNLPGTYTLSFIRYGAADDTTIQTVTVVQMPEADLGRDTGVCEGHELNVSMADSILWSTGDTVPSIIIDQSGLYHVTLMNDFCVATDTVNVSVLPNPSAFAGDDSLVVCKGDSVPLGGTPPASGGLPPYDFSWTPTSGLNNHLISHPNARPTQETDYILVVQDANGCIGADIVKVRVALTVEADAGPDILACEGSAVNIGGAPTATGGSLPYSYSWTPLAPLDNTVLANPSAQVQGDRSFVVTVTDARGCVDYDTMTLRSSALPIAHAGDDMAACPGTDIFLGGNPAMSGGRPPYQAQWIDAGGNPISNLANPAMLMGAGMSYELVVTDSLGCVGRDTMQVQPKLAPNADFVASPYGMTQNFTDLSVAAASWDWDFGNNTYSSVQHPVVTYAFRNPYLVTLTVTSTDGCVDTATQTMTWPAGVQSDPQTWQVYPNPTDQEVNILRQEASEAWLKITDIRGRAVWNQQVRGHQVQLDLLDFAPGIYVLHLDGHSTKLLVK